MIVIVVGLLITVLTCIPVVIQLRTHPRGLIVLFFAEMWERFSYYGMRGLLIFYLTQHFLYDDKVAQAQYGAYTALVFLLPLIGGFVADRWLGNRKAIAFGALMLVAGHFTMGIEGRPAIQTLAYGGAKYEFVATGRMEERKVCLVVGAGCHGVTASKDGGLRIEGLPAGAPLPAILPAGRYKLGVEARDPITSNVLYLALSLIIMGVGFLKASISAIVGQLYTADDPRRDPGFTLYYYGINLGSFWSAILCGWFGLKFGWWAGFGLAGVGMAAGYIAFMLGKPWLEGKGEPPDPVGLVEKVIGPLNKEWSIYGLSLACTGVVWLLVQRSGAVGLMLGTGSVAVLGYLGWFMVAKCDKVERDRLLLALTLIAASVVFWTLFEQAGSSLNQFAERNTLLPQDGIYAVSAAQTQSFNPGFILLFAPVFSFAWASLGRRGLDPNPALKFGLALLQVAGGFFVLVWGGQFAGSDFRVPMIFLILAYLLHTTGELCLSPVGLSQMTRLSPVLVLSTVMATWFLSSSWAQWLGGLIAQLTATDTAAGQVLDPAKALATYIHVFLEIGLWGAGAGVLMIAASPWLKRWAHGGEGASQASIPNG
jgi:POT family proton-dependent oligopeptide transporter